MEQSDSTSKAVPPKLLLTIEEAAAALSMSRRFIYSLVMTHQIFTIKLGRSRRVPIKALLEFIERQTQAS